jgi:hypothetical protein
MRKYLTLAAMGMVITGCASYAPVHQSPVIVPGETSALEELKEISIEARHELRILAKAREAKAQESMSRSQHEQRFFQAVHVPKGFEKRKTFHYTGKAVEAAKAISLLSGYELLISGVPVANEPWVTINIDDQPLNEALKELGLATGDLVRIEIHEAATPPMMRYIYKNN